MIPRIGSLNEFPHFTTTDGVRGLAFKLQSFDLEASQVADQLNSFQSWISGLEPRVLVRVITEAWPEDFRDSILPRAKPLKTLGAVSYHTFVVLEVKKQKLSRFLKLQDSSLDLLNGAAQSLMNNVSVEPCSLKEISKLFIDSPNEYIQSLSEISKGDGVIGVVRLWKTSPFEISEANLGRLLAHSPKPLKVICTFQKVDRSIAQAKLERLLKQNSSGSSKVSKAKAEMTEEFLTETSLNGAALFNFELQFVLERATSRELIKDLQALRELCQVLGEAMIEGLGIAPSFVATLAGSSQHVPILESGDNLTLFLPLSRFGDGEKFAGEEKRALSLHRQDSSLTHLDILSSHHQNANCVIVGSSGRGKSVFLGTLTHSLLNDPNVSVIKVDVGGSHSKECEILGGKEFKLSIDQPSNLNPFAVIKDLKESDFEFVRAVLGKFLETLVLEEDETKLSKEMRVEIDRALDAYIELSPSHPTLTDFYSRSEIPRKILLSRFCEGGLYGNAFTSSISPHEEKSPTTNLRYYNFSQVFQASDTDFAQAGMAAVLAQFNLEMRTNQNKRLVLVCDETPFFIEKCFEFFKFSTANVRKFGASVVLVVQVSGHLTVNGDSSVIENSFHRFLFSADGEPQKYRDRFNLSSDQFAKIKELKLSKEKGSELLYQCGENSKTLNLRLTSEEYWRVTSSQSDRLKLEKLLTSVEGLKLNEAISILSKSEAQI